MDIYDLKMTSAKRKYIASFSTVKQAISENAYNELTIIMLK